MATMVMTIMSSMRGKPRKGLALDIPDGIWESGVRIEA
jgi:hypothetical protein